MINNLWCKFKETFKQCAWAMWLGLSLGIADVWFNQWEFYAVLVPTVILAQWSKYGTYEK